MNLKITEASTTLEDIMWKLYLQYEEALQIATPYFALHELETRLPPAPTAAVGVPQIVQQLNSLQASGIPLNLNNQQQAQQLVNLATAISVALNNQANPSIARIEKMACAYVESSDLTSVFLTDLTIQRTTINSPSGPQEGVKQEILWQRWETET